MLRQLNLTKNYLNLKQHKQSSAGHYRYKQVTCGAIANVEWPRNDSPLTLNDVQSKVYKKGFEVDLWRLKQKSELRAWQKKLPMIHPLSNITPHAAPLIELNFIGKKTAQGVYHWRDAAKQALKLKTSFFLKYHRNAPTFKTRMLQTKWLSTVPYQQMGLVYFFFNQFQTKFELINPAAIDEKPDTVSLYRKYEANFYAHCLQMPFDHFKDQSLGVEANPENFNFFKIENIKQRLITDSWGVFFREKNLPRVLIDLKQYRSLELENWYWKSQLLLCVIFYGST